jgi:chromosome segregation ATPase
MEPRSKEAVTIERLAKKLSNLRKAHKDLVRAHKTRLDTIEKLKKEIASQKDQILRLIRTNIRGDNAVRALRYWDKFFNAFNGFKEEHPTSFMSPTEIMDHHEKSSKQ